MKYLIILLTVSLSSCFAPKIIYQIPTGGVADNSSINVSNDTISGLTDNETFAYYNDNNLSKIVKSDQILFSVLKYEKLETKKIDLAASKPQSETFKNQFIQITLQKFFKNNLKYAIAKCNESEDCTGKSFKSKIYLLADIWCKNEIFTDTLKIVENLPEAIKLTKFSIKNNSNNVKEVKHVVKNENGNDYHLFNIIPKKNGLKGRNPIWIILDVEITASEKYLAKSQSIVPNPSPNSTLNPIMNLLNVTNPK